MNPTPEASERQRKAAFKGKRLTIPRQRLAASQREGVS
jgi:hypothetical protein